MNSPVGFGVEAVPNGMDKPSIQDDGNQYLMRKFNDHQEDSQCGSLPTLVLEYIMFGLVFVGRWEWEENSTVHVKILSYPLVL